MGFFILLSPLPNSSALVTYESLWENIWRKQLTGGEIYFGSQYQWISLHRGKGSRTCGVGECVLEVSHITEHLGVGPGTETKAFQESFKDQLGKMYFCQLAATSRWFHSFAKQRRCTSEGTAFWQEPVRYSSHFNHQAFFKRRSFLNH